MSDQQRDPGRFNDRELLDQARHELSWVTSLVGKEPWATTDLLDELRKKVRTFEHKVNRLSPGNMEDDNPPPAYKRK